MRKDETGRLLAQLTRPQTIPESDEPDATAYQRHRRVCWRYPEVPMTDDQVAAIRATYAHLSACGLTPLFRLPVLRELWYRDRELAVELSRLRGAA